MDYSQEIEANNARIAELRAELAKLQGQPAMGTDAMDYALAANRAEFGDISGAQYHLNKPEERARMFKLYETYGNDKDDESTYMTLQDDLLEAKRDLAMVPQKNTAMYQRQQDIVKAKEARLKLFERKHPNLVQMHWNWRGQGGDSKFSTMTGAPANENPAAGNIGKLFEMVYANQVQDPGSGKVFWKEGFDPQAIYDYAATIPGASEDEGIQKYLAELKLRQTMANAIAAETLENLGVFVAKPDVTNKYNRITTRAKANEALAKWDKLSDAEKNSKEGQDMLRKLKAETQDERNVRLSKMNKEGWKKAQEKFIDDVQGYERLKNGKDKSFVDKDGITWYRDDNGRLSHK